MEIMNMDLKHLFRNYEDSHPPVNCSGSLKNADLWKKFHDLGTEMIITKSGRRMFPSLHVEVTELDPKAHYCIALEMVLASPCRYKYSSSTGWAPAGPEESQSPHRTFIHPDSPSTGEYWMSQPISFGRLKLTNTTSPPGGHLVLSSMHKYIPKIIITKSPDTRSLHWGPKAILSFPETQFIAVTAYQSEKITKLKIDNNPFAKGFRENGLSKCKRKMEKSSAEESIDLKKIKTQPLSPIKEATGLKTPPKSFSPDKSPINKSASPLYQYSSYPSYNPLYAQQISAYSYSYYPHYSYSSPIWGMPQTLLYNQPSLLTEKITIQEQDLKEKPKKLTDFFDKSYNRLFMSRYKLF